jgi:uncharacterized membrane protein
LADACPLPSDAGARARRKAVGLKRTLSHLRAHPALSLAGLAGVGAAFLIPDVPTAVTRCLIGWNVGVWLYLAVVAFIVARADRGHLKRVAVAQAEGAKTVLAVVALATLFSLGAVVIELSAAKGEDARHAWPHIGLALATVVGSWLMLPVLFGLNYASSYHADSDGNGLGFPTGGKTFEPGYGDFFYFFVHDRGRLADFRRHRHDTADAPPRAAAVGAVVHLQHDDPGVLDQHGGEPVLTTATQIRTRRARRSDQQLRFAAPMGHDAVDHLQRIVDQPADRARVDDMLAFEHTAGQRGFGVVDVHRDDRLGDDRTVVQDRGDEVDRRTRDLAAGLDRPPVRVQTGKGRQQRRMDVDEAPFEALDERRRKDPHEAGQRDDVGPERLDSRRELGIERLA